MSESIESLFQEGIQRYQAGESAETLIPFFESLAQQAPKSEATWTCLAWVYLLNAQPDKALKPAQTAVKLNPIAAQSRVNLVLSMLELQKKGVREEVDRIKQILFHDPEQAKEVESNLAEGQQRRAEWKFADRIRVWLFED